MIHYGLIIKSAISDKLTIFKEYIFRSREESEDIGFFVYTESDDGLVYVRLVKLLRRVRKLAP